MLFVEIVWGIIEGIFKLIMRLYLAITMHKVHYLKAPDNIIGIVKKNSVFRFWHFLPSIILSTLVVVKVLPALFKYYEEELSKNSGVIPLTILIVIIPMALTIGILIEWTLESTNKEYRQFKFLKRD